MTLVSKKDFKFRFKSIGKVSSLIRQDKIDSGIESVEKVKKWYERLTGKKKKKLKVSKKNLYSTTKDDTNKVYHEVLKKVVNSRFSDQFRA